jgi:predicted Zn-dependent protease
VFVEDRFFHADLGFSLRFPYGWETSNEPARVMAIAPKHDGVVLLELQGTGSDPIAAAREYAEQEALPLEHGTPLRIGDLPAFRAVRDRADPVRRAQRGDHLGRVREPDLPPARRHPAAGRSTNTRVCSASSCRASGRSHPRRRRRSRSCAVRTARALPGETLAALSARTNNQWDLTFTSVANGVFAHEALAPGQRIKIAVKEHYQPKPPETASTVAPH